LNGTMAVPPVSRATKTFLLSPEMTIWPYGSEAPVMLIGAFSMLPPVKVPSVGLIGTALKITPPLPTLFGRASINQESVESTWMEYARSWVTTTPVPNTPFVIG